MAHIPVNHPARPIYRVLSGAIGLYILVFGVWGVAQTAGESLFGRGSHWVLGLRTNLAFSIASVVFGAFLLIGASRRTNLGHYMNLTAGVVFLVTSILMMSVLQTEANFLNFSMSTVIVSMIFGLVLLGTGLYDKIGTSDHAEAQRNHRYHPVADMHRR
ncbi:DUF4383 domain-containing protein [Micromonospora sp. NPDC049366]|uniref:DUF4383 domain-containing protein n=1 Tax=Micromonospora sp. NPDC049366 TaxID=3364271 RepID=UPI00379BCBC7